MSKKIATFVIAGTACGLATAQSDLDLERAYSAELLADAANRTSLLQGAGEGSGFTLTSGEWFSHPHAPEVQPDGSVLLYDNGNFRPGTGLEPGQEAPYSRVVQYSLDTTTMTAAQTWEYRSDPPRYAAFVGDADQLDNGNVLVTDGGLQTDLTKFIIDPTNVKYGVIDEVDRATSQPVFSIQIGDPTGTDSYTVYRADRIDAPAGRQVN